ncbi:MAG: exosome complex RNA-binding protein Csl4 [Candidatus Thermoplasmatota archaeon]|nr:exosome complex RNA-binding protein Csl4 [Candidatus Thermoplasmatota archaeon]
MFPIGWQITPLTNGDNNLDVPSHENIEKIVLPGEIIANAEEYVPGRNVDEDSGKLISLVMGKIRKDDENLVISVESHRVKPKPGSGDIVYGIVRKGDRDRFTVSVGALQTGKNELYELNMSGNLRVFFDRRSAGRDNISVRVGDYVRTKVYKVRDNLELSLNGPTLGTLIARCTRCRTILAKKGNDLVCNNCENVEKRRMAPDYGNIMLDGDAS